MNKISLTDNVFFFSNIANFFNKNKILKNKI